MNPNYTRFLILLLLNTLGCGGDISRAEVNITNRHESVRGSDPSEAETPRADSFVDISFIDKNQGWAISSEEVWSSKDAGGTWSKVYSFPKTRIGGISIAANLEKIQAISENKVIVLNTPEGLIEVNQGNNVRRLTNENDGLIRGFNFLNEQEGWVVGQSNMNKDGHWNAVAYKTTDGGNSWNPVRLPLRADCDCSLYDVLPLDKNHVVFVGDIILEMKNGSEVVSIREASDTLEGKIHGRPISVDSWDGVIWITSNEGDKYLVSYDGGTSWKSRIIPSARIISDLKYVNHEKVIALSGNNLLISFDSGKTWENKGEIYDGAHLLYRNPTSGKYYVLGNRIDALDFSISEPSK